MVELLVAGVPAVRESIADRRDEPRERATRRILLVDDQPVFAEALATVLSDQPDLKVVGYASSIGLDEAAWVAPSQAAALRNDAELRLVRRGGELDAPLPVRHALAEQEGNLCSDLGDAPGAIAAFERALPLAADDALAEAADGAGARSSQSRA